jgi:plasmid replication initiation protein
MSVEELRAWLAIDNHELRPVKDLRQRAIDVSKAELDKKAALSFTYTPTKVGRRNTGWTFTVKKNHAPPVQRQLHLRDHEPEHTPEVKARNLAKLDDCKREVNGTPAPVARIASARR